MSARRTHAERCRRPRHGSGRSRWWFLTAVVVAALASLPPSVAPSKAHAGALDVLRNCAASGQLGKAFTRADLERALERMPADLAEYSECDEQIASTLRGMGRADRMSAAARAGDADARAGAGDDGSAGGGAAGGDDGGASAGGDGPDGPRPGEAEAGDPDHGVGGALLSGAEAVGSAPLDVVEAAAEGRLGPPWVWPLLAIAALLGIGIAREHRAGSR